MLSASRLRSWSPISVMSPSSIAAAPPSTVPSLRARPCAASRRTGDAFGGRMSRGGVARPIRSSSSRRRAARRGGEAACVISSSRCARVSRARGAIGAARRGGEAACVCVAGARSSSSGADA
jgi:hypothetical protein